MRTPLEKYYFKKEEMKRYWNETIARYEPYLTHPVDGHTWVSFLFRSPYWGMKDDNCSLVMISLWHDRINLYITHWRNGEEIREEKKIDSYCDYVRMIRDIDATKEFFHLK